MRRAEKIKVILDELFPEPPIPLQHTSPYTLLIAVLLSARCTDARVNTVTPTLFGKADTPEKMVKLRVEEIQEIIRPCGLSPQKSKNIFELSRLLLERYDGEVPASFEALEALPGVGHKTASVVLCQAFNIPAFPVDTHIYRCGRRWGLTAAKTIAGVERDLKKCFSKKDWIKLHLQIIHYARAYCPARGHVKAQCPICSSF